VPEGEPVAKVTGVTDFRVPQVAAGAFEKAQPAPAARGGRGGVAVAVEVAAGFVVAGVGEDHRRLRGAVGREVSPDCQAAVGRELHQHAGFDAEGHSRGDLEVGGHQERAVGGGEDRVGGDRPADLGGGRARHRNQSRCQNHHCGDAQGAPGTRHVGWTRFHDLHRVG
jgi:hypothetical protein